MNSEQHLVNIEVNKNIPNVMPAEFCKHLREKKQKLKAK
jgi:hypothetical protein